MQVVSQRFVTVLIAKFHPDPQNPNRGNVGAIFESIEANGFLPDEIPGLIKAVGALIGLKAIRRNFRVSKSHIRTRGELQLTVLSDHGVCT